VCKVSTCEVKIVAVTQMYGMQAQGLGSAIQALIGPKHAAVRKISWPASVAATVNFSRYADGGVETASHGRLRRANYLALLPDGCIVALSNREAEYLLRAARILRQKGKQQSMRVAITNHAFVRWLHPAVVSSIHGALASDLTNVLQPWHAFGGKLSSTSAHLVSTLARNVVAVQLFNGETDFGQPFSQRREDNDAHTQAKRNQKRKQTLGSLLFEGTRCAEHASEIMAGAKQLVQARQRGVYWEGSSLQGVCKDETDRIRFLKETFE
jgi:hypothetical protein